MDIHPPEHPIRSVRDFLVQLFTVTCGIVIALALEGLVEHYQHAALRRQAASDFTTEIAHNRAKTEQFIKSAGTDETEILALITYGTARENHQPATFPNLAITRGFTILGSNAWQNAASTTAIEQFDFRTAGALAAAYDRQAIFDDFEVKARDQWIGIAAFGDVQNLDDTEVRLALRELRVAYAYQHSIGPLAAELVAAYAEAQKALKVAQ
jgi:hypothetical protein